MIRYALTNILRRKARTVYALLGVAVGISVFISIKASTSGIEQSMHDLLTNFRGDIIVLRKGAIPISSRLDMAILPEVLALPGVEDANPYGLYIEGLEFEGLNSPQALQALVPELTADESDVPQLPVTLLAIPDDSFWFDSTDVVNGDHEGRIRFSSPNAREFILGGNMYDRYRELIGEYMAEWQLPPDVQENLRQELLGGDDFRSLHRPIIHGEPFDIIGVLRTGTLQDNQCIIPFGTAEELFGEQGKASALIAVLTPEGRGDVEAIREEIQRIGRDHDLALDVFTPQQLIAKYYEKSGEYDRVHSFIFALTLLAGFVGSISVLKSMASNVSERTREIGVLLAVGWSKRMVLFGLLLEGTLTAFIGGVLGIILGILEVRAVEVFIVGIPIPAVYDPVLMAQAMGLAVLLGLLGTLIPSYRASRLTPVDALRYE